MIPLSDEWESLTQLSVELAEVADRNALRLEILFVDDGSRDRSWETIQQLVAADPRIRGIRLPYSRGISAALMAGFQAASGEIIFQLSADLEDDPRDIPAFLVKMEAGCDVVSGWKKNRYEAWYRAGWRRVINLIICRIGGVNLHDHTCSFRAFRREAVEHLVLSGEMHRLLPAICAAAGFNVGEVEARHRPRRWGKNRRAGPAAASAFLLFRQRIEAARKGAS